VGRCTPIAYTRPTPVFRRRRGGFFGKILKLIPTVNVLVFAILPGVRHRSVSETIARRRVVVARGMVRFVGCLLGACFCLSGSVFLGGCFIGCLIGCGGPVKADPGPAASSVYVRGGAGQGDAAKGASAEADDAERAAQAERIVASSLAAFARVGSISARLRQKARVGPRVLVGTGRYLQTGQGEERKFRFESMLESDSESFELLELCDGLFAWTYRRDGPHAPTLHRIDVRRVHDRLVELGSPTPDDTDGYLGGLPRVLWLTRQWMRFTAAESGDLDGLPTWNIDGTWWPGGLAVTGPPLLERVNAGGTIGPTDLPDGVPWSVKLTIGRGDLMPRRIEWLAIPGERPVSPDAPLEPIAVLELFDMEIDGRVDPAAFYYQPAAMGLMDLTDQHVKTLALFRP
jgi:hypothetical protein